MGWLSLKGDDVTSGAVGFEGLKHVKQLKRKQELALGMGFRSEVWGRAGGTRK